MDERTIVLLNLYFLQPLLIFWGLTRVPINKSLVLSPLIYYAVVFITLFFAFIYAKKLFNNKEDQSIFLASSLVGNTGNLGIPLGMALFGMQSVPYTSIINIANIFFIYIFSVYFFAGSQFKVIDSLKQIIKMPAIIASFIAVSFNLSGFTLNESFDKLFTMAAYSAIVMQLIVFGIFMSQVRIRSANWRLSLNTTLFKHFILPLVGLFVLIYLDMDPLISAIILMELMVPLAVNNVNLSSLYHCKPIDTTFAVLISSFVFIVLIYFYLQVISKFFGV